MSKWSENSISTAFLVTSIEGKINFEDIAIAIALNVVETGINKLYMAITFGEMKVLSTQTQTWLNLNHHFTFLQIYYLKKNYLKSLEDDDLIILVLENSMSVSEV